MSSQNYRRRQRAAAERGIDLPPPGQTPCPDFTDAIMHRLGYRRISRGERRLQQCRRWANRMVLGAILAGAMLIGFNIHQNSDHARQPASVSVPEAISHDIQHQRTRLDDVLWLLDDFTGPASLPAAQHAGPSRPATNPTSSGDAPYRAEGPTGRPVPQDAGPPDSEPRESAPSPRPLDWLIGGGADDPHPPEQPQPPQ